MDAVVLVPVAGREVGCGVCRAACAVHAVAAARACLGSHDSQSRMAAKTMPPREVWSPISLLSVGWTMGGRSQSDAACDVGRAGL